MIATHLGIVDEEQINNMSYIFFEDVLSELGQKLVYDAIVNYAGNSFCEKSWDMIAENNPMYTSADGKRGSNKALSNLANFFSTADVKVRKPGTSKARGPRRRR